MKPSKILFVAVFVLAAFVVVCLVDFNQPPVAQPQAKIALAPVLQNPVPIVTQISAPDVVPSSEEKIPASSPVQSVKAPAEIKSNSPTPKQNQKPDEPRRDPMARAALSLVGIDPDAEQYWAEAISIRTFPNRNART